LGSAAKGFDRFAKCEATYDSSGIAHLIWGRWREGGEKEGEVRHV